MSFQAYLDNIQANTGKSPDDYRKLAASKGFTEDGLPKPEVKVGQIVAWLKGKRQDAHKPAVPSRRGGGVMAVQRNKPSTIDEYLDGVPADRRRALNTLRTKIRSIIPGAEECISYRIPAFRQSGIVVSGFCATTRGCSYFPFSGSTLKTLARQLTGCRQTKSSLHFAANEALPTALVRTILRFDDYRLLARTPRVDFRP